MGFIFSWFKSNKNTAKPKAHAPISTSATTTYDIFNWVADRSMQDTDALEYMADQFDARANSFGFETEGHRAAFIAQTAHESGGFKWLVELGKDAYFKKYDGRKDLGNTQPGDGARYKGRGIIMLTGRANYRQYGALTGLDLEGNPDLASDPENAVLIALHYWNIRDINSAIDAFDFKRSTKLINGGYNGQADRVARFTTILNSIRDESDKSTKIENYVL